MKAPIVEFHHGITDYIYTDDTALSEICDNLYITKEKGLLTRDGSRLFDKNFPQLPLGNTPVNDLFFFRNILFARSGSHLYYYTSGIGWTEVLSFSSGSALPNSTINSNICYSEHNNHMLLTDNGSKPRKIWNTGSSWKIGVAGLPKLSADPVITPSNADGKNYIYRFVFHYTYIVEGVTFEDISETRQVTSLNSADFAIGGRQNVISSILGASLSVDQDRTNIKVKVYRTVHNGTTFYYVGQTAWVGPNFANFTDNMTDTILQTNNMLLYTEGGVQENTEPPNSTFLIITNDIAWYVDATEKNKILQSKQGDVDSVPSTFYTYLDSNVTGLGYIQKYPIAITERGTVYRLDGIVDILGRGFTQKESIFTSAGCKENSSIVVSGKRMYWGGNDGFYFTDGFQVSNISTHLKKTYNDATIPVINAKTRTSYNPIERCVYWACRADSGDNEQVWIMDEDFMWQQEDGIYGNFITFSGAQQDDNYLTVLSTHFRPTSICIEPLTGHLIRGDSRGYIIEHAPDEFTDPLIDVTKAVTDWDETPIIYSWKHIAYDFAQSDIQKWVSKITAVCQNESNLDLKMLSYDNGSIVPKKLKDARFMDLMTWRSSHWIWRDPSTVWEEKLEIKKTRWMVKGQLRTRYKQLKLTNAYTMIDWSDNSAVVNVNTTTKKVTITGTLFSFPQKPEGYFIYFNNDSYTKGYEISDINVAGTELTVLDPDSTLLNQTNAKWQICGFYKGQRLHLSEITYWYELLLDKDKGYYRPAENQGNQ